MLNIIFEKSEFTKEDLQNIFEETIHESSETSLSYEEIIFIREDILRVLSKIGEFAYLQNKNKSKSKSKSTDYNQWILYHTKDDNIVFIVRKLGFIWNWSWRNLTYSEFMKINEISCLSKL